MCSADFASASTASASCFPSHHPWTLPVTLTSQSHPCCALSSGHSDPCLSLSCHKRLGVNSGKYEGPWRGLGPQEAGLPTPGLVWPGPLPWPCQAWVPLEEDENSGSGDQRHHRLGTPHMAWHRPGGPYSSCFGVWAASYLWGEVLGHNFLPFFSQFFIWSNFIFCLKQKKEKNNNRFVHELLIVVEP